MADLAMTLCILTHNRVDETVQLIDSIRAIPGITLEISIADQESDSESRQWFRDTADAFCEVSDRELWEYGFGSAKQKAVDQASNEWIIYGDPGEVWHDNGLLATIDDLHKNVPALRAMRGDPDKVRAVVAGTLSPDVLTDDNGRVFRKSVMKMMGYIHEAPLHKATGDLWAIWAREYDPIAWVEHAGPSADDPVFAERKRILYWHLIHKIVMNPHLRLGTDFHWWTQHWQEEVEPHFKEVSFDEWQKVGG
jgi:hypothetical protein